MSAADLEIEIVDDAPTAEEVSRAFEVLRRHFAAQRSAEAAATPPAPPSSSRRRLRSPRFDRPGWVR